MLRRIVWAFCVLLLLACEPSWGQGSVLQAGPPTPQHAPMYSPGGGYQTVIQDSGPAGGGLAGLGLSETLQVSPSASPNTGTGPLGAHNCEYSAPVNSGAYYFFCTDPNAQGGGLMEYGHGGTAPAAPLIFIVNGTAYPFPFGAISGPPTSTSGDFALWSGNAGVALTDPGYGPPAFLQAVNNFYVSTAGSDTSNTCQVSTAPCTTISHAVAEAMLYNMAGTNTVIHLSAGTWNESVNVGSLPVGSGNNGEGALIEFDGAGSGSTTWNGGNSQCGTLIANFGADVAIENLTIEGTGASCQSSLYAQLGGQINVYGGVVFGAANQQQMHAENAGSQIELWNSYGISGGAGTSHMGAISNALIEENTPLITVTITNTPAFSQGFVNVALNGSVYLQSNITFGGSATGPRYQASANGIVWTNGNTSLTYLPGNAAGTTTSGGLYVGPLYSTDTSYVASGNTQGPAGNSWFGQDSSGNTAINAPTGDYIGFFINNTLSASVSGTGTLTAQVYQATGSVQGSTSDSWFGQDSSGNTAINTPTGKYIGFFVNNTLSASVSSSGFFTAESYIASGNQSGPIGNSWFGQDSSGNTAINTPTGKSIGFFVNNSEIAAVSGAGVFTAQGSAGVSCSGSPTSSFASVGGIVTHC